MEIPEDVWISSIKTEVINAPSETLHHLVLYKQGEVNNICPNTFNRAVELFAASMNTTREEIVFAPPFGLFLEKGDRLTLEVMIHNPDPPVGPGGEHKDVSYAVLLSTDDKKRSRAVEFFKLRLDDTPCSTPLAHEAFLVPAGKNNFVRKSNDQNLAYPSSFYRFDTSGVIVGMGANLWPLKGGGSIKALVNNRVVKEFRAEKAGNNIWSYRIPFWNQEVPIKAGDEITIESMYSNPFPDKDILDASGMLGFYFSAD